MQWPACRPRKWPVQGDLILSGERVTLRSPQPGDEADLAGLRGDPEIDFLMGVDPSPAGATGRQVVLGERSGALADLVVLGPTGHPIGLVSLWDRAIPHQAAELSIWIASGHRNRGLGTDAVRVALRHAFLDLQLHKVYLRVLHYNDRAIRCYGNCGFRVEGTLRAEMCVDGRWHDLLYMGLLRKEYVAQLRERDKSPRAHAEGR